MKISPVGISFQPYIYNTNVVSANSLNKISGIEEDALKSSVDYSLDKNENPLKKGETSNFQELLEMQLQLGKNHAARAMKSIETVEEAAEKQLNTPVIENENTMQNNVDDLGDYVDDLNSVDSEISVNDTYSSQFTEMQVKLKQELNFANSWKGEQNSRQNQGFAETNRNISMMKKAIEAYTTMLAC